MRADHCGMAAGVPSSTGRKQGCSPETPATADICAAVAAQYSQADEDDPIAAIRTTLEAADIEFTNARTPGARMRRPGQ
jgi:hypothetical protein